MRVRPRRRGRVVQFHVFWVVNLYESKTYSILLSMWKIGAACRLIQTNHPF